MNANDWTVDMAANTVTHNNGFTIRFEGDPKDPSDIYPGKFPEGMSFVDQARLLRSGLEFLAKNSSSAWQPNKTVELKSEATKEREELAKLFAERPDKPERAKISLKKKSD